jgi:urease accessory protein UreH
LSAGAFSVGTTYKREEEEFRARVRANNDETAREAAEKYYEAIREELEDKT